MEKISINFISKIVRVFDDGFSAILEDNYLVKFRDSKFKYYFNVGDAVSISIENVENYDRENVGIDHSVIYVKLHSFLSNGFLFRDSESAKTFFWKSRGILTHKKFQTDNLFEEDDILKIIIQKVYF